MFPTNRAVEERLFSDRDLRRLIIPLVIEQFLALFIGMADTVMVSTVSESAVSAISLVDSINVLLTQLFSAMATGGAVVAAQYLGRRDNASACGAAKQLMYVADRFGNGCWACMPSSLPTIAQAVFWRAA